jgi:hypothetical protein
MEHVTLLLPVLLSERFHDYLRGIRRKPRFKKSEAKKTRVLVCDRSKRGRCRRLWQKSQTNS